MVGADVVTVLVAVVIELMGVAEFPINWPVRIGYFVPTWKSAVSPSRDRTEASSRVLEDDLVMVAKICELAIPRPNMMGFRWATWDSGMALPSALSRAASCRLVGSRAARPAPPMNEIGKLLGRRRP